MQLLLCSTRAQREVQSRRRGARMTAWLRFRIARYFSLKKSSWEASTAWWKRAAFLRRVRPEAAANRNGLRARDEVTSVTTRIRCGDREPDRRAPALRRVLHISLRTRMTRPAMRSDSERFGSISTR